jgi:hypothetical protein
LREFLVQSVEEAGDVHLLRPEPLARGGDDAGVEAQALGGGDSGRCPGHTETQLIVTNHSNVNPATSGMTHSWSGDENANKTKEREEY